MKYKPKLRRTSFSRLQLSIFILAFGLIGFIIWKSFAASNPNLPGDLNNDNTVNVTDLSILLSAYGTSNTSADINGDGLVNVLDMSVLLSNYGKTYTPAASFTTSLTSGMTITPPYTWTFNPGVTSVKGYFWADGNLLFSGPPNASGGYSFTIQASTLTAGAHTLGHAWDLADGTHQTPSSSYPVTINTTTPPPPPPPTGTIYFDGRAKNMISMSSTGWSAPDGSQGTIVATQNPVIWDCLCFDNNSMTLGSDSYYGKTYNTTIGPGNRSPWNNKLPANDASAQVSKVRPNDLGKVDYFSLAVKVPSTWQNPDWASLMSLGYETLAWDQIGLDVNPVNGIPTFQLNGNTGYVNCPTTTCAGTSNQGNFTIQPVTFNQWTEFIFQIKWATDKTGYIKIFTRIPGGTWSLKVDRENIDTYLYGTTSYRTVQQDMSDEPTVLDKMGLYYGYWNTATTSFPYETIYENGFTRSSDMATAQSTLP